MGTTKRETVVLPIARNPHASRSAGQAMAAMEDTPAQMAYAGRWIVPQNQTASARYAEMAVSIQERSAMMETQWTAMDAIATAAGSFARTSRRRR